MSYIGNSITQQSFTGGVDQYNGNNSNTAFGLTRTINTVYDVDVYVENVWQRPTTGYTVSANTITFTSAPPAGSNNVVVVYRNFAATSIVPQQGSVTTTSFAANAIPAAISGSALSGITTLAAGNTTITGDLTVSANVNFDSGTFVLDGTNNRVGVGTSSPSYSLHIKPSSGSPVVTAEGVGTSQAGFFAAIGADSGSYPGFRTYQGATHYWSMHQRGDTNLHLYREAGSGGVVIDSGTLDVASRGITKGSMPAGSVLQVFNAIKTDAFTTSGTSFADVPGLSITITPTSTSSKILITYSISGAGGVSSSFLAIQLVRNSTAIAIGDAYSSAARVTSVIGYTQDSGGELNQTMTYLDSPATTSATTYKITASSLHASVCYINRSQEDNGTYSRARPVSSITVMEVAV